MVRSSRVAATLRYAGHEASKVGILDGGFEGWVRAGGAVSDSPVTPTPSTYTSTVNEAFIVERPYVHTSLNKLHDGIVLVDARPSSAYADGHIESAVSLPMAHIWNEDGTFKPVPELLETFESVVGDAPVSANSQQHPGFSRRQVL
ncbi:hypothetical protein B0I35DRAFT_420592 [Stachybotrys elegans]|uniref:Rhodanese domain-containing protein n=1 Tax=Stachybotrys elegans TaxID=80388 RepID=A0A8K0T979_9HYPO|nr:hypothetical protein B0I35DRAFT_420592 [Stachybotrys elegans]